MWQTNLFNNLLVIFILLAIFAIIYCKIKDVTIMDLIKQARGI